MGRSDSNWPGIVFGLCLASYAAFQQFKLPPAMPLLLARYDYDRILAGGLMSIYAVAGLFLSVALGRSIERRGTTRPIMLALLLMAAGTGITLAVPHSGPVVLAARGLEGVAFAVLAIAGPVLANAHASARHLPFVIALTAAWIPIGQLAAVVLARPAFALMGWSGLWWLSLVLTAGLLAWTLTRWRDQAVVVAKREPRHDDPPPTISPAEKLSLTLAATVFMLWSGQYLAYMTWLPQYLVEAVGLSVEDALLGYTLPVVVLFLSIMVSGRILQLGVPVGGLLITGLGIQTLTWVVMPWAGDGLAGVAVLVVYGAGAGLVPACLFAMPSAIAGHARAAATAFGIIMTGRNLGVLVGPLILAQIFAMTGAWDLAAPVMGGVTGLSLALAVWLALRLAGAAYGTSR